MFLRASLTIPLSSVVQLLKIVHNKFISRSWYPKHSHSNHTGWGSSQLFSRSSPSLTTIFAIRPVSDTPQSSIYRRIYHGHAFVGGYTTVTRSSADSPRSSMDTRESSTDTRRSPMDTPRSSVYVRGVVLTKNTTSSMYTTHSI